MYKKFVKKEAKYERKCYTQYDQNNFYRLHPPLITKSSESEEFGPTSSKLSKRVSLPLGEIMCFICNKPGSKTAGDKQHVKETTKKIKTMAVALDNKPILAKLSGGDFILKKLSYNKSCYKDFVNKEGTNRIQTRSIAAE